MESKSLIKKLDKTILAFVNKITEVEMNKHDQKMFYETLNGTYYSEGYVLLKYKIGSKRRMNFKIIDKPLESAPYNEFIFQIRISANSFHLMATIFHNEKNQTEGMSYSIEGKIDSGLPEETWVLPNEDNINNQVHINGRNPKVFLEDIINLLTKNYGISTSFEMQPTKEVYEIRKQFDNLMISASIKEIDWAISNELEKDEKIRVLQNLNPDRKLQIIQNITTNK